MIDSSLSLVDPVLVQSIAREAQRQEDHIELIASENYVSRAVLAVQGSILTNKYAEGYPGKRYYGGCQFVDEVEQLAIDRAKALFAADYANVQPHSGSQANMAVYMALLKPGDTVLGMNLSHGGHLTHGSKVNFSGRLYQTVFYGVDDQTGEIDYDALAELARAHQPKLIVGGFSAYSLIVDWARMRQIADEVGAYLLVDMAHVAGLVAAGCYPSPLPYADVVTTTTHKTLRGPRGGLIVAKANPELEKKFNSSIFPGIQGGPLMHVIAAKAVAFHEALQPDFKVYQKQVVANAQKLASELQNKGFKIVGGRTENHLLSVDLTSCSITGRRAEALLDSVHITVNKNTIPNDPRSPMETSGIRLGTPAITTRGFKEPEVEQLGHWLAKILSDPDNSQLAHEVKHNVLSLCAQFPVYV